MRLILNELAIQGAITGRTIQEETDDVSKQDSAIVLIKVPGSGRSRWWTAGEGVVLNLMMKNYVYVPPVRVGAYQGIDTRTADGLLRQSGLNGRVVPPLDVVLTPNPRQDGQRVITWQSIPPAKWCGPGPKSCSAASIIGINRLSKSKIRQGARLGGRGTGGGGLGGGQQGGGGGGGFF